ncbi:MAG: transglycosylase SLT domain-containing protein [bacterium]|nr:transglycosylase SLT domain-containing protein [bacterium]
MKQDYYGSFIQKSRGVEFQAKPSKGFIATIIILSSAGLLVGTGATVRKVVIMKNTSKILTIINNYKDIIRKYATMYKIQPSLIVAMIMQESGGNPNKPRYEPAFYNTYIKNNPDWIKHPLYNNPQAVSSSYGLLQIMYPVAWEIATPAERIKLKDPKSLNDPDFNISLGTRKLSKQLAKFPNQEQAIASYNAGNGCIKGSNICFNGTKYKNSVLNYLKQVPLGSV